MMRVIVIKSVEGIFLFRFRIVEFLFMVMMAIWLVVYDGIRLMDIGCSCLAHISFGGFPLEGLLLWELGYFMWLDIIILVYLLCQGSFRLLVNLKRLFRGLLSIFAEMIVVSHFFIREFVLKDNKLISISRFILIVLSRGRDEHSFELLFTSDLFIGLHLA